MDQRERHEDVREAIRAALDGALVEVWTALPGIVIADDQGRGFNPAQSTCRVQIAIKAQVRSSSGTVTWQQLPPLVDVPIVFPGGGGFLATFPIQPGDEVLVIFSARCIDAWWQSGGVQQQAELRLHDLSDGFAIPAIFSVPRVPANISTTRAQLRSSDGSTYIELAAGGVVNIVAPGGLNVNGAIVATGEVTAKNTHTVSAHIHGGVTTGAGTTGGPTG